MRSANARTLFSLIVVVSLLSPARPAWLTLMSVNTPALDQWKLTWRVEEHKVYVPLVLK